jgi:hypothetical protein
VTAIGALAHQVRQRFNGNTTYYVMNQHINYSNICVNGCRFCAFAREPGDPQGFQLTLEEILGKVRGSLKDPSPNCTSSVGVIRTSSPTTKASSEKSRSYAPRFSSRHSPPWKLPILPAWSNFHQVLNGCRAD